MELVLVRHAQPEWEPGGLAVDEPSLSARGRAQARRVAEALADERFDALYTSPLRRARETAAPIAARLCLEPQPRSWLAELRLPPMGGMTSQAVRDFFARRRTAPLALWWEAPPGGESFRHFYERVAAGIESLLLGSHAMRIHAESGHRLWQLPAQRARLLIVAHEGTNAVLLSHLLGVPPVPWAWLRFSTEWAGIARLRTVRVASGFAWELAAMNRIHHLAGLTAPESDPS